MEKFRNRFINVLSIGLLFFGLFIQGNAQISRTSQREVGNILRSLNVKIDDFRYDLNSEYSRSSSSRNDSEEIRGYLDALQNDISSFQNRFNQRRESPDDVSQILSSAKEINDFVKVRSYRSKTQADWTSARTLIDQLASNYGVSPYWNRSSSSRNPRNNYPDNYPGNNNRYPQTVGSYSYGLTGTYELDTARSEDTRDIAAQAINDIDTARRDENRRDLEDKLEAPTVLALNVQGNQITLASTRAPQLTFTADGRDRSETLPDGRTVRLRTTLRGQELTVSSVGGDNDYTVTFTSIDNGRSLKVTRRITTDYLKQTIFAESVYNKTDSQARLDIYDNRTQYPTVGNNYPTNNSGGNNYPTNYPNNYPPTTRNGRTGQFVVPNGTILTGTLDNDITTKVSQNNDRFRMTVTAPNQYRGAVIEGYLSGIDRSGKVTGRSQITFNFETIRLTNGNSYDFAGYLQNITDTEGKNVSIDSEGTAKGDNQTKETAKRGGIGAGIGAIIGAIAGGGKGAAIGAIIGGGAGAGSVYIQGKDDLELKAGSSITVQASSPAR